MEGPNNQFSMVSTVDQFYKDMDDPYSSVDDDDEDDFYYDY